MRGKLVAKYHQQVADCDISLESLKQIIVKYLAIKKYKSLTKQSRTHVYFQPNVSEEFFPFSMVNIQKNKNNKRVLECFVKDLYFLIFYIQSINNFLFSYY